MVILPGLRPATLAVAPEPIIRTIVGSDTCQLIDPPGGELLVCNVIGLCGEPEGITDISTWLLTDSHGNRWTGLFRGTNLSSSAHVRPSKVKAYSLRRSLFLVPSRSSMRRISPAQEVSGFVSKSDP